MIQKTFMILKELLSGPFINIIVLISFLLSVVAVGLHGIASSNLNSYVQKRFATSIPPNTIKVSPRQSRSRSLFSFNKEPLRPLTAGTLKRMRGLKGVKTVFPVASLDIPLQARLSYLAFQYRSDILAFGVPYHLVSSDIKGRNNRRLWKRHRQGKAIPVLVPRSILQSYNDGMARANNLPRISEQGAVGLRFKLLLGRSSLKTIKGYEESEAVVAGFTDRVDSFALIMPLNQVMGYNRKLIESYRPRYQYAYLKTGDHSSLIRALGVIKKMGYAADVGKSLSQQILKLKSNVALILDSLKYIIVLISVFAAAFATVIATMNRIEYYRVIRIVGGSRVFLTVMILFKYLVIGTAGILAGLYLVKFMAGRFAALFNIGNMIGDLTVADETRTSILLYGSLVPVISTLPALARLFSKGLSGD
jgi:hypothetical protein